MGDILFLCEHCGARLSMAAVATDRRAPCPVCGKPLRLPVSPSPESGGIREPSKPDLFQGLPPMALNDPGRPAPPPGQPPARAGGFAVRFQGEGAQNTSKLQGRGTVAFEAGGLVIRGRRQASFSLRGKPVEIRLDPGAIVNVVRQGASLEFSVPGISPEEQPRGFSFTAASEPEAAAIERSLPERKTAEFVAECRDSVEFSEAIYSATPKAFVTTWLAVANVAVLVWMVLKGVDLLGPKAKDLVAWGANFGPLTLTTEPWRLFTSCFIHIGLIHLFFNLWVLLNVGYFVERLFGNRQFLLLYVAAGLSGSLVRLHWNPQIVSAGASGAIFGVFGGLGAFLIRNRHTVPSTVLASLRSSTLGFIGYNLIFGAMIAQVDNAAHLGGLVGGFAMGLVLTSPRHGSMSGASTAARPLGAGLLTGLLFLGGLWLTLPGQPGHWLIRPGGGQSPIGEPAPRPEAMEPLPAEESLASEHFNRLGTLFEEGKISQRQYAAGLEAECLPRWRQTYAWLEKIARGRQLPAAGAQRVEKLLKFMRLREQGCALLVAGLKADDQKLVDQGYQLIGEAEAIAGALKEQ